MTPEQLDIFDAPPPRAVEHVADIATIAPPYSGSLTSFEAAESMREGAKGQRERLYALMLEAFPHAYSDEELAELTNLNPNAERPRRVELAKLKLIEVAGFGKTRSGRRCQLWRAVA